MAEFEALRLGTWLDTPEGEFFAEAIEMVSPPFYRADVDLLIEALQIAANEQQHRGRRNVALGVGAFVDGFKAAAPSYWDVESTLWLRWVVESSEQVRLISESA